MFCEGVIFFLPLQKANKKERMLMYHVVPMIPKTTCYIMLAGRFDGSIMTLALTPDPITSQVFQIESTHAISWGVGDWPYAPVLC